MLKCLENKDEMKVCYARGGVDLHRGVNNRFLLEEINLVNRGHGKLLTRKSSKRPDYSYYFEEDDLRLIEYTPERDCATVELIFRKDEKEVGLEFDRPVVRKKMRGTGRVFITETSFSDGKVEENIRIQCGTDVAKHIWKDNNAFHNYE